MLVLIGILIVLAAVVGGFLLEQGNLLVLLQPSELLIIVGSAAGIVLVANSAPAVRGLLQGALSVFKRPPYTRAFYEAVLKMLYELFTIGRRVGMPALEDHIEDPAASPVFQAYPEFGRDPGAMMFLCDSLRMVTSGIAQPGELAHLMGIDADVQGRERHGPVNALGMLADSLPGLGIVAAVLGVVVTMQALGGAPEQIGQKVAAALVGTFLGILLCYGVVGPIASRFEKLGETEAQLLHVLRIAIVAFARGASPILAVEYARRSVPVELRPSFLEMEITIKREARIPPVPKPIVPEAADAQALPA
jgi:chemotaxis protein MotA